MSKPENLKCPDCEGPMVSRLNKKDNTRFWGCKDYPKCRGTRDVEGLSKSDKAKQYDMDFDGDDPLNDKHEYNFNRKRDY